jgi:WD40 repeat protein
VAGIELPNGDTVTSAGKHLYVWQTSGPPARSNRTPLIACLTDVQPPSNLAHLTALAVLPDGKLVASMDFNGAINAWYAPSKRSDVNLPPNALWTGHTAKVGALLALRDGRLVSAGRDCAFCVWHVTDLVARVAAKVDVVTNSIATWALAELPDGRLAVTTETSQQCVRIYRLDAGLPDGAVCEAELSSKPLRPICSSSNSNLFLLTLPDGRLLRLEHGGEGEVWTLHAAGHSGTAEDIDVALPTFVPAVFDSVTCACIDGYGRLVVGYSVRISRDSASHTCGAIAIWRLVPGKGAVLDVSSNVADGPLTAMMMRRNGALCTAHAGKEPMQREWELPPPQGPLLYPRSPEPSYTVRYADPVGNWPS